MNKIVNNKYLSGLLAGMLTVGIAQGSDGKENMSGLGDDQTPMVREQSISELPEDLRDLLLSFNQSLAEKGYQAQVSVNAVQTPSQMTQLTLGGTSEMQKEEPLLGIDLGGSTTFLQQTKVETDFHSAREMKERTQKDRVPLNEKGKVDPYSALVVAQYMDVESIKTLQEINTKYGAEREEGTDLIKIQDHGKIFNQLKKNPCSVTDKDKNLFSRIQTQKIFGPNDCILPGMHQYIIAYPVTKREIESWVDKVKQKNKGILEKSIIVECQTLDEKDLFGYLLNEEKSSCDLDQNVASLVTIKNRKYSSPIFIGRNFAVSNAVQRAIEAGFEFEKIVLDDFHDYSLNSDFPTFNKKNVHSLDFAIKLRYFDCMSSDWATFLMGCFKCLHVPCLKQIDCGEDLFVVSRRLGQDSYTFAITLNSASNNGYFNFYAPFLEKTARIDSLQGNAVLFLPCVTELGIPHDYLSRFFENAPKYIFVSPEFNIDNYWDCKTIVKRYTEGEMAEIEKAKQEWLHYIAINPELSGVSLNRPKPDRVSPEKWRGLMQLKERLIKLMRSPLERLFN